MTSINQSAVMVVALISGTEPYRQIRDPLLWRLMGQNGSRT
jgi:hypothetical protein